MSRFGSQFDGLLFRQLSDAEDAEFRAWARANWKPGDAVNELWHPVVRDECKRIEEENSQRKDG